jgi:hypothetical protein
LNALCQFDTHRHDTRPSGRSRGGKVPNPPNLAKNKKMGRGAWGAWPILAGFSHFQGKASKTSFTL